MGTESKHHTQKYPHGNLKKAKRPKIKTGIIPIQI